ncbi:MAG TPA: AAA family ATPase [Polyangia bacterium]|jgi:DNA polymerase-3 subunit gamma/tau
MIEALRAALDGGKLHHAYLFEGPVGAGKAAAARELARVLECETRRGCGECAQCAKVDAGTHPDVVWFDMTPKGLTERVRELLTTLGFRPHEGRARVVIFDPAHGLAPVPERAEAANVLLKTLEEPPADTYFVLVTAEPKRLPVTVLSRCQRIRFAPPPESTDVPEALAGVEKALAAKSASAMFEAVGELAADRDEAIDLVLALWKRLRDALLVREAVADGRVPSERAQAAATFAAWPAASLFSALRATDEATESLRGNVAPSLVLEHLMLQLREVRA